MKRFFAGLREMGFERPRAAIALLPLSLFTFLFALNALIGDPQLQVAFACLSACYLTAFLAVASEWFWARWFASGLGWSGAMLGLAAMVMMGEWNTAIGLYGIFHALVVLLLSGPKMAARYDLQEGWRQRFGMDEYGVLRLRKAVTRASAALPSLIFWAFGPRQSATVSIAALALAVLGLRGLVRLRTWGVLALGGAGVAVLASPETVPGLASFRGLPDGLGAALTSTAAPGAVALLLLAATLPFASAAIRYYRSLR